MRRTSDLGPLFSSDIDSPVEGIAKGEISPYESSEDWGNGANPDAQKELGQVATPPEIASIMAKWICAGKPATILDPAVGLGNLLFEAHKLCPSARLFGIEQDTTTHEKAILGAPSGTRLILADYLKHKTVKMDAIIANPPYVKSHHLSYNEGDWAFFDSALGANLDRLTNLYALFLLKIYEDLAPDGRGAIIIPAEFLNANFGVPIKKRLIEAIRPSGIAVFDTSFQIFKKALTTSCILFVHKGPVTEPIFATKVKSIQETEEFVQFLLTGSLSTSRSAARFDVSSWDPADKWLNRIIGAETKGLERMTRRIGDYFCCRRGIATGGNDYFTLSRAEIESRNLRMSDFSPCIVHATHARGLAFGVDEFEELAQSGKKCYLLDPKDVDHNLQVYLDEGVRVGISEKYLPSHRPVWYRPENRNPAEIWVGVFSRESVKCVMNYARVKNLTCFHGLYLRAPQRGLVELMTLFLNSSYGKTSFGQENRFYGNGLNKLEPKDVEAMPCPAFPTCSEQEVARLNRLIMKLRGQSAADQQRQIDGLLEEMLALNQ